MRVLRWAAPPSGAAPQTIALTAATVTVTPVALTAAAVSTIPLRPSHHRLIRVR